MGKLGALKVTQPGRKKRWLEAFSISGNVWKACEDTGCSRTAVYYWQEHDDKFAMEYRIAAEKATERLEEEARRRASDGVEKPVYQGGKLVGTVYEYSDTLLMFLLKARKPEKYKDRMSVDVNSQVKAYSGVDVESV